jgi:C1A family cysteine protease
MENHRFGWTPDTPDQRDFLFRVPRRFQDTAKLPDAVDLTPAMPPVYDQGNLGSCTANAIGAAYEYLSMKQGDDFMPSRLFIYYNERVIEGSVESDSGAMIRDGVKSVAKQGVADEKTWPYLISKFDRKPPPTAYTEAKAEKLTLYQRVFGIEPRNINELRSVLAGGLPVVFGFSVYESFETATVAKTGKVPMPKAGEKMLGGHAVLAVGYNHPAKRIICRNSWGAGWGLAGYFTLPYAYLTRPDLSDDFWQMEAET